MIEGRVSIILPAHDAAAHVGAAVASLAAQDWPDLELIVVDDGSQDATAEVLERSLAQFRASGAQRTARLIRQDNRGLGGARNAALDHACGAWILFCDADDILAPGAVRALVQRLEGDAALELVFPRCRHIDAEGHPLGPASERVGKALSAPDLIRDNPIHTDTGIMLRAGALARAGRFDPDLPACIGLDFWVRATAGHGACIACIDAVLADYRRHPGQITSDWRRQRAGWNAVAARAVAAGLMSPAAVRRARGLNQIVWATTAYQAEEYGDAQRLIGRTLLIAPDRLVADRNARIRLFAVLASLLPPRWHDRLRARYNR